MIFKRSLVLASIALATLLGAAAPAAAGDDDRKRQRIEHRHGAHGARHHAQQHRHDRHARSHRYAQVHRHGHHARHHGQPRRGAHYARWDSDRDGVPNRYDRRPHNPYRR